MKLPPLNPKARRLVAFLALNADWYVPTHHGLYDREGFRCWAEGMLRLSRAAGGAEDLEGAKRAYTALTGKIPTADEREVLGEYLNAGRCGKRWGRG